MEIWEKRWEKDQKEYHEVQKTIRINMYEERNRREETTIARLRINHTVLNGTLYIMGKSDSDKCGNCGVKEDVEHILLHCDICRAEREKLKADVLEAEREWSVAGVLGTKGEGVRATRKALFAFLSETGVGNII